MAERRTGVEGVMAGVEERVREFLGSWAIVKQQVEEVLGDGRKGVVEFKGSLQAFENIHTNALQAPEGEISTTGTPVEGDVEIQPD